MGARIGVFRQRDLAGLRPSRPGPLLPPFALLAWVNAENQLPFGIVIRMYWNERDHPVPHLHAEYGEHRAAIDLDGQVLGGTMPPRALRYVREWTQLHRDELMANWNRARDREPLEEIEPLT